MPLSIRCPRLQIQTHCLENGLKDLTLISPRREPQISSPKASPRSQLMPSTISFPPNDDYLGTESCNDLRKDGSLRRTDSSSTAPICHGGGNQRLIRSVNNLRQKKEKKEFPPLIPSLPRTEYLHSHMPWVLKRYYTSDGRLILKEEKVNHEYFRAHRANGRLTLQLVPLDDDVFEEDRDPSAHQNDDFRWNWNNGVEESSLSSETNEDTRTTSNNGGNDSISRFVDEDPKALENDQKARCLKYDRFRSTKPSIFGVRVHPIRTGLR